VGQLFQTLQNPVDEDNNTLSFFMSDNGYLLGRELLEGKLTPYTYSLRSSAFHAVAGEVDHDAEKRAEACVNVDIAPTIVMPAKLISLIQTRHGRTIFARRKLEPSVPASEYSRAPIRILRISRQPASCQLGMRFAPLTGSTRDMTGSTSDSTCDPDNGQGGYAAPPFREFYGRKSGPTTTKNDIMQMQDNLYGGDGPLAAETTSRVRRHEGLRPRQRAQLQKDRADHGPSRLSLGKRSATIFLSAR